MAVKFDNVDDQILCGTASDVLNENSTISISLWLNQVGAGTNGRLLNRGTVLFYVDQGASSRDLIFEVGGSTIFQHATTNNAIVFGADTHILLTWDGSTVAANCHVYKNGVEIATAVGTNGILPTDNSGLVMYLGNNSAGTRCFNGRLWEVAIWNTVLNAPAIATLANGGNPRGVAGLPLTLSAGNLKMYLPLKDFADGTSLNAGTYSDLSGLGNHGTGNWGANGSGLVSSVEQGYMGPSMGLRGY